MNKVKAIFHNFAWLCQAIEKEGNHCKDIFILQTFQVISSSVHSVHFYLHDIYIYIYIYIYVYIYINYILFIYMLYILYIYYIYCFIYALYMCFSLQNVRLCEFIVPLTDALCKFHKTCCSSDQ